MELPAVLVSVLPKILPGLLLWLAAVNLIAFTLFGIDKRRAKRGKWRIAERTLLLWAALGGSVGALLGMRVWHHKTRHLSFRIGIPLIFLAQLALAGWMAFSFIK